MAELVERSDWTACSKTSNLPSELRGHFTDQAEIMLSDLDRLRLEVVLLPATQVWRKSYWGPGQKIRAVANRNPAWYRESYHELGWLRRDRLARSLGRIAAGSDRTHHSERRGTSHDCIARSIIVARLALGWQPEPIGDLPELYSPANCARVDLAGLEPVSPINECQTISPVGWLPVEVVLEQDKPALQPLLCS